MQAKTGSKDAELFWICILGFTLVIPKYNVQSSSCGCTIGWTCLTTFMCWYADEVLVSHLLILVPSLGDDSGARNALWSILGRIFRCLVATKNEPPCSSMIAVLTDSCSLLLDDLDDHQEDDIREDEGGALPASHTMANNSRGLQAKLTTVSSLCFLKGWRSKV